MDAQVNRARRFVATLLQIAGEYLVMARPEGAPLALRRAVRMVARERAYADLSRPWRTPGPVAMDRDHRFVIGKVAVGTPP